MTGKQYIVSMRERIQAIAKKHGAYNIRFFGSVARGDERPDSDVDLLVAVGEKTSPWFPGGLVADLENLLGRKVDIVTEKGLNPYMRDSVEKEAISL